MFGGLSIEAIQTMFTRMIQGYCAYDAKTGKNVPLFCSIWAKVTDFDAIRGRWRTDESGSHLWLPIFSTKGCVDSTRVD